MRSLLVLLLVLPSLALADEGTSQGEEPGSGGELVEMPFDEAWNGGDLPWALPATPGFAEQFCDVVLDPDPKEGTQAPRMWEGMSICIAAGTFESDLRLQTVGLRVVALKPGTVIVKGDVTLAAPAVVAGLHIGGDLLLHASARGSVLIGNVVKGAAISETKQVVLAANEVQGNGEVKALGEGLNPALYIPTSAMSLYKTLPLGTLVSAAGAPGNATGWVNANTLQPAALMGSADGAAAHHSALLEGLPTVNAGGSWATLRPPSVKTLDRLANWMPVYGSVTKEDVPAVVIPLEAGPWGPYSEGVVVTTK